MAKANEKVEFKSQLLQGASIGHGYPKSPMQAPTVYIEDYTLSFVVGHPDYLLNIKDEDGNVVFSTVVWSAQTEVVLPSILSGDYEIEIVMGNWLFTGWITII
jgi:hypothetical protein